MGEITVDIGEPRLTVGFTGRWLVEPDPDESRAGRRGYDTGAYWGVALTRRGRFAVFAASRHDRWAASLHAYDSLDAGANDGVPGESSPSPLPNSGESGFSGGTCDTLSAAREARSPLVGLLLASWIGLRTLSFFSSPDKTLGLQRPSGKEARLAAVGRESGCGDRQAVPAVRRQLHGPREKRQKEIDTIVIACKLLTRGPSRVDQAAPGSSHEVRHNARRLPVRWRARGATHDHLPAHLDQSAPGGTRRGRASLAARPVAVRPAACALAHMAERRHRSDLGVHDSKQPNGTPV
jgi:hypothetical protein